MSSSSRTASSGRRSTPIVTRAMASVKVLVPIVSRAISAAGTITAHGLSARPLRFSLIISPQLAAGGACPKPWLIVLAVGLTHAPAVGRVIRSATLDISERDYVKVVELQGMRPVKVMASEILPNLISPLMVEAGLRLTYSIVIMAGLSFLGFGQQPPAANWGLMINENRSGLPLNPWAVIVPAVLIALLTIGTNTFTDAIARVTIGVDRRPEEAVLLDELTPGQSR